MRSRPLCFVCILIVLVWIILLIMTDGDARYEIPVSSVFYTKAEQTVVVEGQVYRKSSTSNAQIYYLKNNSVSDSILMIYDKNFTDVPIGKVIRIRGEASLFDVAANPGNFNQRNYYVTRKIYGFISMQELQEVTGHTHPIAEGCYRLKVHCQEIILEVMGEKNGGILSAMILGEKHNTDADVKEVYQKMGIGHILVISGLHISLVGFGVYSIFRKMHVPYALAGLVSVGLLGFYVCMIGMTVSVLRAFIMLILRIGADMTGRVYDMLTALAVSATITICYQPLYLMDGGFLLSYGAILGILVLPPALKSYLPWKWKMGSGLYANGAISLMLFPIMLWYYYEIATYSIILNIIVIPFMSVLISLGMIGGFLEIRWCLRLCGVILNGVELVANGFAKLPFSRIVLGKPKIWMVILYYIVLLYIVWGARKKNTCKKRKLLLFLVPVLVFCLRTERGLKMTMLDVGQGDCIYVRGQNNVNLMIDGGSSNVTQVGKYRIEPFLLSQGVSLLDYVFVSHGDGDHINGIHELLEHQDMGVKVHTLVVSELYQQDEKLLELIETAKKNQTKVQIFPAGMQMEIGGMKITCLHPYSGMQLEENASSMVLDIQYEKFDVLLTGDVEEVGEDYLIQSLPQKKYDVLKVAHHGSKNSCSVEFLQAVQPKIGLISAGKKNSYGHPHKETLERLWQVGCRCFETKKNGAITIGTDGNSLTIDTFP